jgi:ABC-type enterochelin transport system substrate-binding protein
MTRLTYNELLENYRTLIELVMDLKAEKEAHIEASNNEQTETARKLLDLQHEIDRKIAQMDKRISEMLETKKQIDYLLGLPTERN